MRILRAFAFPVWLAGMRLATRAERVALVALSIVAGAGMLAAVLAESLLAQDRRLRRAAERVPQADGRALWLGIPARGEAWPQLNATATGALGQISAQRPLPAVAFR
ncbi:MAG: hypothetical protein E6G53_04370, partial [Actinobacteria bacterium]